MGNSQKQIFPPNFYEHCHPELTSSNYNEKQDQLQLPFYSYQSITKWKHKLYPISHYNRHLFLPVAFRQNSFEIPKCCSKDPSITSPIKVCYDPYIYTLKNQIIARKLNNRHFREAQLWKVIRCCSLALRDWEYSYPSINIGKICPQNFLINSSGIIKLAHTFSFPNPNEIPVFWAYSPSENRKNAIVRYSWTNNTSQNPNTLSSIFSLGITLLDMVSLEQAELSPMPTQNKKQLLDVSELYNKDIKQLILGMTQDNLNLRPTLLEVQLALKKYKQLSKYKEEVQ